MKTSYSEERDIADAESALATYRDTVRGTVDAADFTKPESALATWKDDLMKEGIAAAVERLGSATHVVLVGIGGSSLGVEAVHAALPAQQRQLHVLDAIDSYRMEELLHALGNSKKEDLAICVVSKSGSTTETLTNADVLLHALEQVFGESCYDRVLCIGDPDNPLLEAGAAQGAHALPMHEAIGGRYCVFTAAGLAPLALLGHDIVALLEGARQTLEEDHEYAAVHGAATLFQEIDSGMHTVNFFGFDLSLKKTGFWYRQLAAESLGKEQDRAGREVRTGFIPAVSTPVELHSTGQLYFSGYPGVYTDIVHVHEEVAGYAVSQDSALAPKLAGKTMREINGAIFDGVIGAYRERGLPHRITALSARDEQCIGLFLGNRMLETMYLAELLNVDAFDQPNVELYKNITRKRLDI